MKMLATSSSTDNSPRHSKLDLTVIAAPQPLSPRRAPPPRKRPVESSSSPSSLTKQLLLYLTNCADLSEIQVVAIRNRGLEQVMRLLCCCSGLHIAYLSGNRIRDLEFLSAFANIRKLDLSNNELTDLPPPDAFSSLANLRLCYFHDNYLSEWNHLKAAILCPGVLHFTFFGNPVAAIPGYRHFMVNACRSLLALDTFIVTDEELLEDACFGYRFRSMGEFMKLHLPEFPTHKTASEHLFNLEVDIYRLRRLYERNSPVIMIQRVWRGYFARHFAFLSTRTKKRAALRIQKCVRGWLLRKKLREELKAVLLESQQEYLLYSSKELSKTKALRVIARSLIGFLRKRRELKAKTKAATVIQTRARGWLTRRKGLAKVLDFTSWPHFYILREQRGLLFTVFEFAAPKLMATGLITAPFHLRKFLAESKKYRTVRTVDPETLRYSPIPLIDLGIRGLLGGHMRAYQDNPPWPQGKPVRMAYHCLNPDSQRVLSIIRQRSGLMSKARVLKNLQQRPPRALDQYYDLYCFHAPRPILESVIQAALDFNRRAYKEDRVGLMLMFEPSLRRVSAAIHIQTQYRAYLERRTKRGFGEQVVEHRAACLLQSFWTYLMLRKRLSAMASIKKYLSKIRSSVLYIEEWLYLNLEHIALIHARHSRFQEQCIDFDVLDGRVHIDYGGEGPFSTPTTGVQRYENRRSGAPAWLCRVPRLKEHRTQFCNIINALFHCSEGCELLPYSAIVGTGCNPAGVRRDMRFVRLNFESAEQARRRAYVVAVLTHSFISQTYVRMFTAEMLSDGFFSINIKELWDLYNIQAVRDFIDPKPKAQISRMARQQHNGLLVREPVPGKDATVFQTSKGTLFLCEKARWRKVIKETQQTRSGITPDLHASVTTGEGLNISTAQPRRSTAASTQPTRNEILSSFMQLNAARVKLQREINRERVQTAWASGLQERRDNVRNLKEIHGAIKREQRKELNQNLKMFQQINGAERKLRKEILARQREQTRVAQIVRRGAIWEGKRRLELKRSQQEFCASFAMQKNVIAKQMKLGEMLKRDKQAHSERRMRVERAKAEEIARYMRVPLQTSLFDSESLVDESRHGVSAGGLPPIDEAWGVRKWSVR